MSTRGSVLSLVVATLLFSGCLGADDAPSAEASIGGGSSAPSGAPSASASQENAPPTAVLQPSVVQGQAPLLVVFTVTIGDPEGDAISFELDADGDGSADFDGAATIDVEFTYGEAGQYTAALTATDGANEVTQSVNITVTPAAGAEVPEPIVIQGTILAGAGGCAVYCAETPTGNRDPFELNALVNNFTAEITWGGGAVDLDWGVETPSGILANQERDFDLPLPGNYAEPLFVDSPTYLAEFGTWHILIWPGAVVAGTYEVTITFQ